jgi:hypothetical protein
MNKLKLLDLFSGIGGFSLGLESTGYFQTIAFVEKDKFCRQVLQKNFNNIPIEEDIRNVRGSNYAADVITGGFPCQPFSVAGKRKGTEMIAISGMKLLESLPNANRGGLLEKMLKDLLTSTTAWSSDRCKLIWKSKVSKSNVLLFQLQASVLGIKGKESGLLHAISYNHNNGSYRSQRNETEQSSNKQEDRLSFRDDKDVPNTNTGFKQGGTPLSSEMFPTPRNTNREENAFNSISEIRMKRNWWQTQSEFCGVPNGISYELDKDRSSRIKALGNSIVPQIARQIGLSIMKGELN